MAYDLRIPGSPPIRFEDEREALKAAALALRTDRTAKIELIDIATNRPAIPADRRNWHEEYKKSLGL
jgi:hypothetical protein